VSAFLALIEFLVAIGLLISLVSSYLIVNKLWKRRANREVAESISIVAALLGLGTSLPFLGMFLLIDHSAAGAIKTSISIAVGVVFVLIGCGLWVPEYRERGLGQLFLKALRLERKESTHLLRQLVQPKGADRILKVLTQLASVDGHVDEKEAVLIRDFAREWKLDPPELEGTPDGVDLITLRRSVSDYLEVGPPRKQAGQLLDLLQLLTEADDRVTWEESIALEEVGGMLRRYAAGDDAGEGDPMWEVLIVPQSEGQMEAVRSLLPDREEKWLRGGRVFSAGHFFSPRYAEVVCQKYIALGLFTTLISEEHVNGGMPSGEGNGGKEPRTAGRAASDQR
jgi:hypothetical protein